MSGCDAVLRWGENRLIRTHWTLRSGRIEQRKCRLRVETGHRIGPLVKTCWAGDNSAPEFGCSERRAPDDLMQTLAGPPVSSAIRRVLGCWCER